MAATDAAALVEQFTANPHRAMDKAHFERVLGEAMATSEKLDALIASHAVRSLDQLDEIGRSILFVGLTELSACEDVPSKVVINEAIELAKRYGAKDSYRFINAVLDKAARELRVAKQ